MHNTPFKGSWTPAQLQEALIFSGKKKNYSPRVTSAGSEGNWLVIDSTSFFRRAWGVRVLLRSFRDQSPRSTFCFKCLSPFLYNESLKRSVLWTQQHNHRLLSHGYGAFMIFFVFTRAGDKSPWSEGGFFSRHSPNCLDEYSLLRIHTSAGKDPQPLEIKALPDCFSTSCQGSKTSGSELIHASWAPAPTIREEQEHS